MHAREIVVLPDPDSPIRAITSPARTSKETRSTIESTSPLRCLGDDGQVPYFKQGRRWTLIRALIPSLPHSSSGSAASVVFRNQSTSMLTETVTRAMHNAGKIGA